MTWGAILSQILTSSMGTIFESASKIVFILLAITACIGFMIGRLEATDFMMLASMAFVFYFANKGSAGESNLPYLGK